MRTEKLGCTVHVHGQRGRALGLVDNASKDPIGVYSLCSQTTIGGGKRMRGRGHSGRFRVTG